MTHYTITPPKKFNVYLKSYGGNDSILVHRGRTEWSYRTANKHRLDCVARKLTSGMFAETDYFAVVEA